MRLFDYKAKVVQDEGDGSWFVRLHRKQTGNPSDGGEFVGICGANGIHEAEMVAECINAVIKGQNEDAMVLVRRMFEWSRSYGEPTTGPVCDDCGCPSPDSDTLHSASGIRICHACEARAAAKAREYEKR